MEILLCLLVAVVLILVSFYGGILVGISDCKRSYGIGKGVTPEEFNNWCETLESMAYEPYVEVE